MIRFTKKDYNPNVSSDFNSLYWISQVTKKGDERYHIVTIKVESGVAFKTDGKRIHAACLLSDIDDGFYEVLKRTKGEIILSKTDKDGAWPEVDSILSECPIDNYPISFAVHNQGRLSNCTVAMNTTEFFMSLCEADLDTTPAIDADFVSQSLIGFLDNNVNIWVTDENHPVFMVDDALNKVSVIMPYRRTNQT